MIDLFLFRGALRDLLRPKRLAASAVLIALPAALAGLIRWKSHDHAPTLDVYNTLAPAVVFGFVLVILAVVFATGVISQEVEQKTIVYLLTRPVARWRTLMAKFAAVIVVVTGTTWLALCALALVLLGPSRILHSQFTHDLAVIPVGALAYGAVFLLLATVIARPLLWGLIYSFGIETWTSYVPGLQKVSLMYYLHVVAPHRQMERESVDIREFLNAISPISVTSTTAWIILGVTAAVALLAALAIFSVNEYVPREDAE